MVGGDTFCEDFGTEKELSEEMGLDDAVEIEVRLRDLLSSWTEKVLGERTEVNIDLRTQVKGKGKAV